MLLISYDINEDKLRTKFSKYLKKFGERLQYSVFEIKNSERVLVNIETQIKQYFEKRFTQDDSIMIFHMSASCTITRYGYAKNQESDVLIF